MTNNLNFVNNYGNKGTGSNQSNTLTAEEWNGVMTKLDTLVTSVPTEVSGGSSAIDTNGVVSVNSKGNTTISATKHVNIEPAYDTTGSTSGTYGDVLIKPGDDITLESHHRATNKRDEITIKTSNGQSGNDKAPVKLQVIASDMTLSTKGKHVESGSNDSTNVMNINVTTGDGKGYLKVRAQAIDLRCEEHGGIALQPKGQDNQHNENKIKFEHGGGDGLEFATFNTEKTSIFTDEYRFNREGVWKMATRLKTPNEKAIRLRYISQDANLTADTSYEYSDNNNEYISHPYTFIVNQEYTPDLVITALGLNKTAFLLFLKSHAGEDIDIAVYDYNDSNNEYTAILYYKFIVFINATDPTSAYKYKKASDDFYDYISVDDEQATTKDIIKTAFALNGGKDRHTKITNKGAIEIATNAIYTPSDTSEPENLSNVVTISSISTKIAALLQTIDYEDFLQMSFNEGDFETPPSTSTVYTGGGGNFFTFTEVAAPNIKIDSGGELKLGGILDFGSSFNFGETDNGIQTQYKLTKKNATKDCGILKVLGINNHTSNTLTIRTVNPSNGVVSDYTIPSYVDKTSPSFTPSASNANLYQDSSQIVASCSLNDIIMFVNWAKGTGYGPWSSEAISNKKDYTWNASTGNWTETIGQLDPSHQL